MTLAEVPIIIVWDEPRRGPLCVLAKGDGRTTVRTLAFMIGGFLGLFDPIAIARRDFDGRFRDYLGLAMKGVANPCPRCGEPTDALNAGKFTVVVVTCKHCNLAGVAGSHDPWMPADGPEWKAKLREWAARWEASA